MGNLASSSYSPSTRNNNAHLDTIAEDMVRTKEIKCEERSRVGGGSDVGGLYKPQDYGIKPRRTNGTRQRYRFVPSGAKGFEAFAGWPARLREEMKGINALNLQPAVSSASINLEIRRKSYQRKQQSLARVDEELEPLQVNSDSGSVASSDAALRFLRFACPFGSSENEPLESDVPTCNSLTFESDDGEGSVGSSSVAEPAMASGIVACLAESQQAVPSFLTEDPTDSDNDSSDEVPCDANLPKTDDPAKLQEMSSEAAPNGSAPETATDASPTAGAAQAGGGASSLGPLGLASFLQKRVLETKTSGQNIAEDITGSRRGTSQLATVASPTLGASQARNRASLLALELGALEEEHSKLSYVSLVGAVHGERWCFPGVGKPPEFLVPLRAFRAEDILGKYLVKLTRQQEGWALLRDEATGETVLSLALVSAFVGGDGLPY